jgi:hypothetical protein
LLHYYGKAIWMQQQYTDNEYTGQSGAYYYFDDLWPNDPERFKNARATISDHVPVWAEFRTDLEDDDKCL